MAQWLIDLLKLMSGFVTSTVSKWLFALVGAKLLEWGVTSAEDTIYKIVAGLVGLAIAAIIGLLDHKKAVTMEPPVK